MCVCVCVCVFTRIYVSMVNQKMLATIIIYITKFSKAIQNAPCDIPCLDHLIEAMDITEKQVSGDPAIYNHLFSDSLVCSYHLCFMLLLHGFCSIIIFLIFIPSKFCFM